jgi:hypothetical protein
MGPIGQPGSSLQAVILRDIVRWRNQGRAGPPCARVVDRVLARGGIPETGDRAG